MRVAITGSTGFIGRHILSLLANQPDVDIVAVTRELSIDQCQLSRKNLIQFDLQNPPSNAFDLMGKPDVLIHLAWGGLPNYNSLHHFDKELPMHYKFLQGLVQSGLGSIVVAGTCSEYGMLSGPLSEDMETQPNNPYGFAKDVLRRQLEYLKAVLPFALSWARLFYLYGEGQAKNSLFPQLKCAVEQGEKNFNMSGGEQIRDYLPVSDVAKYLVALALTKNDGGVVNICSGKPISIRKLVEGWIQENGWSINLNLGYYPYPDYEPMAFWGVRNKLDNYYLSDEPFQKVLQILA